MELEDKAKEIASAAINRMIEEDNYDAVHELAARVARAESCERLLDISGLHLDNQNAIRQIYIEIVGGIPHGNTLDLSALSAPVRDAFESITVGLLAWQMVVKEQRKAAKLTECPKCGPHCKGILCQRELDERLRRAAGTR
jgi:hypothetical protein